MKIIYNKLRENAVLPFAATEMSGGLDLTAAYIEHVSENEVVVYLGLAMQPPPNYRIRFSPRSSFTKHNWVLQNSPTLGDADFTGEYRLRFRAIPVIKNADHHTGEFEQSLEYESFPYQVGDRCAQMWVEEIIPVEFEEGQLQNHTDRKGGFGSTDTQFKKGDQIKVVRDLWNTENPQAVGSVMTLLDLAYGTGPKGSPVWLAEDEEGTVWDVSEKEIELCQ